MLCKTQDFQEIMEETFQEVVKKDLVLRILNNITLKRIDSLTTDDLLYLYSEWLSVNSKNAYEVIIWHSFGDYWQWNDCGLDYIEEKCLQRKNDLLQLERNGCFLELRSSVKSFILNRLSTAKGIPLEKAKRMSEEEEIRRSVRGLS